MTSDGVLVLSGLVLAHLVADFVLQTDAIVADKAATGPRAWRGVLLHAAGVAVCLVPFVVLYGLDGAWVLVAVTASHALVDRWKVIATRRAEARALVAAHARRTGAEDDATSLGPAWTPAPAALFAADQLVHLGVLVAAWAIWLDGAVPLAGSVGAVDRILGGHDRAVVHQAVLATVVISSLLIANIRGAALFVATLVHPREAVTGAPLPDEIAPRPAAPVGWRLRVGPLVARADPIDANPLAMPAPVAGPPPGRPRTVHASPARVGATIGVLERLLIVTFVLTNATAAIGFVVAAKTLARFKQLDDRDFAEYYLLGTLASVAVALGSAIVAAAALRTAGL